MLQGIWFVFYFKTSLVRGEQFLHLTLMLLLATSKRGSTLGVCLPALNRWRRLRGGRLHLRFGSPLERSGTIVGAVFRVAPCGARGPFPFPPPPPAAARC